MLVLSRREQEKVCFPSLGITFEVLKIRGKTASIGIEAPPDIPVLRDELMSLKDIEFTPDEATSSQQLLRLLRAVRQQLDQTSEQLCQLHQDLERNDCRAAEEHVLAMYRQLRGLESETEAVMENAPPDRSINALVVESDERERQVMESVLQAHHVNVMTARDGQDALDHLSLHAAPDFILLDMEMLTGDGTQFVKQLRAQPNLEDVRVFALGGMDSNPQYRNSSQPAIDGWFAKPVDHDRLVGEIIAQISQPVTVA